MKPVSLAFVDLGRIAPRFWRKVKKTEGCWEWIGCKMHNYGVIGYKMKPIKMTIRAHRLSYVIHYGSIPEGLDLDHLCRNPSCVRPDHLEAVTRRENILRGINQCAENAKKTHCRYGHAYSEENTFHRSGHRVCKTCSRETDRARYVKKPTLSQGAINRMKTHCPRGHALSGENLGLTPAGGRMCRACRRRQDRECKTRRRLKKCQQ